jgi:hypothetical protein
MSEYTDKNFNKDDWQLIKDAIKGRIKYLERNLPSNPSRFDLNQVEDLKTLLRKVKISKLATNKIDDN